jgi:hypothetical protein
MDKVEHLIKLYSKMTGESVHEISTHGKDVKAGRDKAVKK